jgi:hypothetical protein
VCESECEKGAQRERERVREGGEREREREGEGGEWGSHGSSCVWQWVQCPLLGNAYSCRSAGDQKFPADLRLVGSVRNLLVL